jgi:hypothetical protein
MDIPYRAQGAVLYTEESALSVGWLNWHLQIPGKQFREFSASDDFHFTHIIITCHVTAKGEKVCFVKFPRV